jgi:rare lipoprotein A
MRSKASVIAAALLLAGCMGGGSGSGSDQPVLPPADVPADDLAPGVPEGGWREPEGALSPAQVPLDRPDAPTADADRPPPSTGERPGEQRYDTVGYASWYGEEMGSGQTADGADFRPGGISAASRDLPLGAFAEVTALDTGRTILVPITDRGPNVPGRILDLSRGAAQLLGTDRTPVSGVRVRRVTPSAADQAALRSGRPASTRADAPQALLAALRRKLPAQGRPAAPPTPAAAARPPRPAPRPAAPAATASARGGWMVQVATLSAASRAEALASSLNGRVVPAGQLFRVQLGPFGDAAAAERARADAARRGYGDARVFQTN